MKKKLCNRWACGGWNLLLKVSQFGQKILFI